MSYGNGQELSLTPVEVERMTPTRDLSSNPFKLTVDPAVRQRLKQALLNMIDTHDTHLAEYITDGKLDMDSYKEYIELFAKSLRESMESREGVQYLMSACGFEPEPESINMNPQWRWKNR
jgi:hypothetical protein